MARILVRPPETAAIVRDEPGFAGASETRSYFAHKAPVQVHLHRVDAGGLLRIGPTLTDCLAYVWKGRIEADSVLLEAGSSLIIEHGASLAVSARDGAMVVTFAATTPSAQPRAGGEVHLLPCERVPRAAKPFGAVSVTALHADGACPSCEVWLHENLLTPSDRQLDDSWIHSHSEDEAIFVLDGQLRLGNQLYGPGTAVSIAARTNYTFTSGPEGMRYINFRPARPGAYLFSDGRTFDEPGMFRDLPPLSYIDLPRTQSMIVGGGIAGA